MDDRDPLRAALLRAADELVAGHRLSDRTWRDLTARYPTGQIIEICLLAGVLNSLGVQIEDGFAAPDRAGGAVT
ncbi:hypothetical protein GCM10022419_096290 [Nonomuraea rosea]|uniref:Uncharacterized protein n=1 Tax=Nonomuraea rosea TaxID=638574 RepID=A0ABP6Z597_9ACTN